jgi:hypothetical protein
MVAERLDYLEALGSGRLYYLRFRYLEGWITGGSGTWKAELPAFLLSGRLYILLEVLVSGGLYIT